jgi:arylsulfatase A-like enzyme
LRVRPLVRVAAVSALLGCGSEPAADNLLFISFDTTRADHLSAYGHPVDTSPVIDALAARGALFERAYTHVPSTLSAHSSMLTGLLPPSHGVRCNGKLRLAEERLTLAEILRSEGFATAAVLAAFPLDGRFGLGQGFDLYDDDFAATAFSGRSRRGKRDNPGTWIKHQYTDFERGADEVTDRALGWLRDQGDRWFLFVHYFDPHAPYEPASHWAERFDDPYDAEIAYADFHLGRLLDEVATMPGRTLIVFTADHGEGLDAHDELRHGLRLYDTTVRIPLVIVLDGTVVAGQRIEGAVAHVDLVPTVLDLLRVAHPPGLEGQSLAAPITGGRAPAARPVYIESLIGMLEMPSVNRDVRAIVMDDDKYILTRSRRADDPPVTRELYDIAGDPGEMRNRAGTDAARATRLDEQLTNMLERLEARAPAPVPFAMDADTRRRLESLGYLGGREDR